MFDDAASVRSALARLGLRLFIPKKSQKGLHDVLALLGNYPHGYSLHNSRYSDYDAEWMDFLMFGIIGTVGVIAQMALLAFGAPIHAALLFGLGAAVCWIFTLLSVQTRPCSSRIWLLELLLFMVYFHEIKHLGGAGALVTH